VSRLFSTIAAAIATLALIPAAAAASTTWFGSSLDHTPANAGSSCDQQNSNSMPLCTHVGSFYPGFSGRAQAPVSGTVIKIKVRAENAMTLKFKLVKVRHLSSDEQSGQAKVITVGPKISVPGPTTDQANNGIFPIQSFRVNIKVQKGEELAIDTSNNQAEYCSDGTPGQLTFFNPVLSIGQGFRNSSGFDGCLLLVQAVVKH
jgi:hypothetical protein